MSVLNILSFVGFTALVAILSYYWTKGTDEHHSEGYFLGGRSLTAPVIAGSLLLTNLSTEQMVGLIQEKYGYTREAAETEVNKRVAEFEANQKKHAAPVK